MYKELCTADEEFMKDEEVMENEKDMEDEDEEDMTEGELWDDVMFDFFPSCKNNDEIADELDDLWND